MAIIKRFKNKGWSYQVKIKGSDGKWITETFDNKLDAEKREARILLDKRHGGFVSNVAATITLAEYYETWSKEHVSADASTGWKKSQFQMFRDYVKPVIGTTKLQQINPGMISKVLNNAAEMGRGPATRLHIYGLLHKMFEDAVESYDLVPKNPVIRKLRPKVPYKEAAHLDVDEVVRLLKYVEGKRYQAAIWLQLLAGLRVGEVQYLKWEHVDLKYGIIHVRGTYRRKEGEFHDVPKGGNWHRVKMPPELLELLKAERERAVSDFVVRSPNCEFMSYISYAAMLKRYCKEASVPVVSTHGLRHSTAELYMANGASRGDLRILFDHSSEEMTDRYVHDKGRRLDAIASNVYVLKPRPELESAEVSQKLPKEAENGS